MILRFNIFYFLCAAVHRTSGFSPFQLMFGRIWNPLADYHQLAFDFEVVNSCGQGLAVVEDALVLRTRQLRMYLSWVAEAYLNGVVQAEQMRVLVHPLSPVLLP